MGKLKRLKPRTDQGERKATPSASGTAPRLSSATKPEPDANKDSAKKKVQPRSARRKPTTENGKPETPKPKEPESQDPEEESTLSPILKKLKPLTDKYGWSKIKRKVKLVAIVVAVAIAAKYGYGFYSDHQDNKAKEKAAALVEQKKAKAAAAAKAERQKRLNEVFNILKNCQDMSLLSQMCMNDQRKKMRKISGDGFSAAGDFVKAGRIYAELGLTNDVSTMIRRSRDINDEKGAQRIMDEIRIISEARVKAEEVVDKRIKARMMQIKRERETRIRKILSRLAKCEDKTLLASMCVKQDKATFILNGINMAKDTKDYERAGILYARLGVRSEARKMIGKCFTQKNKLGMERIREELRVNAEAIERFTRSGN